MPWYLARLKPAARTLSIALVEVEDDQRRPPADLPYDYVWFTARVDGAEDPSRPSAAIWAACRDPAEAARSRRAAGAPGLMTFPLNVQSRLGPERH